MAGSSLIGSLAVSLGLETAAFKRGAREATSEMSSLQQRLQNIGQRMGRIGVAMSASITAPFAALVTMAIPAAREARQALGQVEAANRSMGQAAGFSTEQLQEQAGALMALSTFDDDEILGKVTANLLTFGNISGEVFERTQLAVVNLSARMGTDLQAATMTLGRALNDPVKGMNALARAGIQFTDAQKAQIRAMVAAGDAAGAQRVMLGELERQFGGAAQAMRDATPGADVKNQWDNLLETVGELALNVLPPLTDALAGILGAFNQLSPETQTFIIGAVAIAAALGPVLIAVGALVTLISSAIPVIASIGAAFVTFKVTMAAAAVAAGGLVPALAALLSPILIPLAAAIAAVYIAWQNWETIGPFVEEMAGAVGQALSGVLDILQAVAAVLRGDFSAAWEHIKNFVTNIATGIGRAVMAVLREVRAAIENFLAWAFGQLDRVAAREREFRERSGRNVGAADGRVGGTGAFVTSLESARDARGVGRALIDSAPKRAEDAAAKVGQAMSKMAQDTRIATSQMIDVWNGAGTELSQTATRVTGSIADRFRTLGTQIAEPVRTGAEAAAEAVRDMARDAHALLARLFPELQRAADLQRDLGIIGGMGLDEAQQSEARRRLFLQNGALDPSNITPINNELITGISETGEAMGDLSQIAERANRSMIESYADMARSVIGSLRGMVQSFKSGDILGGILGILESIAQIAGSLGGGGPSGSGSGGGLGGIFSFLGGSSSTYAKNGGVVNPEYPGASPGFGGGLPRWASGGGGIIGGMAGVDRNLLSLNGQALARVSRGEVLSVTPKNMPAPANDGGGMRVQVVPSPYFDVHVASIARTEAEPLAGAAAVGGAAMARRDLYRRGSRALP